MALNGLVAANNLSDVVNSEEAWDNIGNSLSATIPIPSPTLDLDFANNRSLIDNVSGNNLITFDRASTGTFVNSSGNIQAAASGVPRFSYKPSLGLLVEGERTNLLLRSEEFENASWLKVDALTTANAIAAPDGSMTADKLIETTSTNPSGHYIVQSATYAPNTYYTFSVFVKAGERSKGYLTLDTGLIVFPNGPANGGIFDLSAKTFSPYYGGVGTSTIIEYSNGWFRLSLTALSSAGGFGTSLTIRVLNNAGDTNYAGDNTSGFYIWGAQLEVGAEATSYISTTTATVTRAADIASISGSNFSSWYNQAEGAIFADVTPNDSSSALVVNPIIWDIGSGLLTPYGSAAYLVWAGYGWLLYPPADPVNIYSLVYTSFGPKTAVAIATNNSILAANGLIGAVDTSCSMPPAATTLSIGKYGATNTNFLNGTIKRLTYYPARLPNVTLQGLSLYGAVSSFPYSFSVKGRDILALKEVNKVSTRDFVLAKGLSSKIQPRITTASQYTSSGVVLRNAAMPKIAPTTRGNYFFSTGLTLSGVSCQINGTNARSIATSPFSGSGATVPLLLAGLRPQANWRISEPMASGTVTAPETAIPIETSDFVLFIKAGQN